MAKRGQKAKPKRLKVVDGSGRPNAETRGTGKRGSIPGPPDHIPELGKEFWRDVAPALEQMGIGTDADKWGLEGMAVLYAHYREALKSVEENGVEIMHEKKGVPVKNPSLVTVQQNYDKLRIWFNEFGLTPAARASLADRAEDDDNVFAEFVG